VPDAVFCSDRRCVQRHVVVCLGQRRVRDRVYIWDIGGVWPKREVRVERQCGSVPEGVLAVRSDDDVRGTRGLHVER